jgi:ATP-dependent Clp protease adaptor protein ClpS
MAIEKLNMAAMAAQPKVISMMGWDWRSVLTIVPRLRQPTGGTVMVVTSPTSVQERQHVRQPYPHFRVIVLDDSVNTFQHVVDVLVRHIPGMTPDRAWNLAHRIDGEGAAVVWSGPQEQAELYHQLLAAEGLTMAPLERA